MAPADITREVGTASSNAWDSVYQDKKQSTFTSDVHRGATVSKVQQDAAMDLPTLTKAELAELLFEHVRLNKREAKDMLNAFFTEISDALERGETVKLSGFGNFQLRDKVSRPGRNPKTGVDVSIPARRVVTFRPGLKLKSTTEQHAIGDGTSVHKFTISVRQLSYNVISASR